MALDRFEALLHSSIGLDVASLGAAAIERAVFERQRACGLRQLDAYWDRVRSSREELQALIDVVVVPETWFFRDRGAFDILCRMVTTEWLPAHSTGIFRLLSVPSSTGEEPYSMSMALLDAGVPPERFQIDAVDVSVRSLERAERAVYGKNSFRGDNLAFRNDHFTPAEAGLRLHDRVRKQVRFSRANLCAPDFAPGAALYDAIFCRNLLIYFDRETQARAIGVLERLLAADGLLCVAPSETGVLIGRDDTWSRETRAFGFRRRPAQTAAKPRPRTAAARPRPMVAPPTAVPARRLTLVTPAPAAAPPAADSPIVLERATTLANQGLFADAAATCEQLLTVHGPSAEAFHLLGVVREAMGAPTDAAACYRKALYLEPQHQGVLMHLALLLEKLDQKTEAQVLRNRERRIAQRARTS
jgi:chemotaxis protein methyltransferase WspC